MSLLPGAPENLDRAGEVGLVQVAVNWFGHYILEDSSQAVTLKSWGQNFKEGWEFDANHFSTNQFAHPYSGNINFNAARPTASTTGSRFRSRRSEA